MQTLKIAIIDDHDLFREGLILLLNQINNFSVIFDTSNGHNFIDYLHENPPPDVVLMDIQMPEIDGEETTRIALEKVPSLKIIALTLFSDHEKYTTMMDAGVRGFLTKNVGKMELQLAIEQVSSGFDYFSQQILQEMAFNRQEQKTNQNLLTPREQEILNLICRGLTTRDMAEKLFVSPKTIEVHRSNIFSKTNVRNIAELITWAIKHNFFVIN